MKAALTFLAFFAARATALDLEKVTLEDCTLKTVAAPAYPSPTPPPQYSAGCQEMPTAPNRVKFSGVGGMVWLAAADATDPGLIYSVYEGTMPMTKESCLARCQANGVGEGGTGEVRGCVFHELVGHCNMFKGTADPQGDMISGKCENHLLTTICITQDEANALNAGGAVPDLGGNCPLN